MTTNHTARWMRLARLSLSALLALLLVGGAAAASPCKKINGKVTLQVLPSSACPSAISLCASGSLKGCERGADYVADLKFTGGAHASDQ